MAGTTFSHEVLTRLPLAQATLELAAFVHPDAFLDELYQRYRGDCYENAITFPHFLRLLRDALLERHGSFSAALDHAAEQGQLDASRVAYYGKLRRTPLRLSVAYLRESAALLRPLGRPNGNPLPASLDRFHIRIFDGKKLKRVAKRLRPTRGSSGKLFGGKLLVSWEPRAELVDAMAADPDGEVNECRLVPALLEQFPDGSDEEPWLFVADRQFGDKKQPRRLLERGFHFLFRRNAKTHFHVEPRGPEHAEQRRRGARGRDVIQQWGWLGQGQDRVGVRQITLRRPGEEDVVVVTDLLDAAAYPADDLLELYRRRWGIEQVFGQITEVFGLARFIGSSPEATVFQAAFCLLLYNLIGVVKGYVAQAGNCAKQDVSSQKLFTSIHEELVSLYRLVDIERIEALVPRHDRVEVMQTRLSELLAGCWKERYRKAKEKKPRAKRQRPRGNGSHTSVFRLQQQAAHKERTRG
jgi:Transposase DDE domain